MHMETIEYTDLFVSRSLSGRAVFSDGGVGISDVQIAVRSLPEGPKIHLHSDENGSFKFKALASGTYEVVSCFDGFDALAFRVRLDPGAADSSFLLHLGPSETGTSTTLEQVKP